MNSKYLGRAQFAYNHIVEFKNHHSSSDEQGELKSYSKKIPTYIQTNGLLATMAFVKKKAAGKKGQAAYTCIYDMISEWFREKVAENCSLYKTNSNIINIDFISVLANEELSMSDYKYIEQEIIRLFTWVRRFAESELDGEE